MGEKSLVQQVEDAKFNQAGQWIQTLENHIGQYFMVGLHAINHPISGIATELRELFEKSEGWLKSHAEAHAKKYGPVLTEVPAPVAADEPSLPTNATPITEAPPAPEATS